jgi:hypothetical protein
MLWAWKHAAVITNYSISAWRFGYDYSTYLQPLGSFESFKINLNPQ